jgi:hypothetical protein
MRMDIENSPGALAGRHEPAAREIRGQRFLSDGAMCGNCLCCMALRDLRRERRAATLSWEHGSGVLWHHVASTLNAAIPSEGGRVSPKFGATVPVSIAPALPQPLRLPKNRRKPRLAKSPGLS